MIWDVLVVGGGVIGCAVAHRLAQQKIRVCVIERAVPGAEASSAAAGMLGAQSESRGPGPFFELALRSRLAWPAYAGALREESGVDLGYWKCGLIELAHDREEALGRVAWQLERGLRAEWLDASALREREPAATPEARGALYFADEAQVEPRLLMRALQLAAARAGVTFRSAYVRRIVHQAGRARGVELEAESLEAKVVVLAAGSWSGLLDGTSLPPRSVRPVRGQMVELEMRPLHLHHVLESKAGYLVPRRDGRIVCGSTMEEVGYEREVTARGVRAILDAALTMAPGLAGAALVRTWSNFRPATEDALPLLGASGIEGLLLATGHFRNGILLAPVTAEVIASLVVTGRSPVALAPFSVERLASSRTA